MKMIISIFSNYKVKCNCKYSYINEYGDFSENETNEVGILDGYKLIEQICRLCQDDDFFDIYFNENLITIGHFNPNTEESADYLFEIQEIIDEGEDN